MVFVSKYISRYWLFTAKPMKEALKLVVIL